MTPSGGSSSSSGGTIVVAKSDLSSNALQTVVSFPTVQPRRLGDAFQLTVNGSNVVTAETPYGVEYLAPDGSGNMQGWQIVLTNTASVPTPVQRGVITGAPFATTTICSSKTAIGNIFQPTTGFAIIQYAVAPNTCGGSGVVTIMITGSYTSTTPVPTVPVAFTQFADMYLSTGQLYGLVGVDPSTSKLNLYLATAGAGNVGTPTFTSPTTLLTGVATFGYFADPISRTGVFGNTVAFLNVNFNGTPAPAAQLIRVDTTGTATSVHTASGTLSTATAGHNRDNTNFYFIDAVTASGTTTYNFYAAPIAGGNASLIGSVASSSTVYTILDSDGTSLLISGSGSTTGTTIYKIAVAGPSSQSLVQVVQALELEAALDYASGELFVDEFSTGAPAGYVFKPSGATPATPILGPESGVVFADGWGVGDVKTSGNWLQVSGVTSTTNWGGGHFELFSTSTLTASTAFTCPLCTGGGTYAIPTDGYGFLGEFSTNVAFGEIDFSTSTTPDVGLAGNPQTSELVQFSASGLSVVPFY